MSNPEYIELQPKSGDKLMRIVRAYFKRESGECFVHTQGEYMREWVYNLLHFVPQYMPMPLMKPQFAWDRYEEVPQK